MTPPPSHSFRPGLEALEDRTLMAGSLMASLSGGALKIWGTEAADHITVRQVNQRLSIDGIQIGTSTGAAATVATTQVSKIEVYSYGGNDVLHLDSEKISGQQAITLPALINAGNGNDLIYGDTGSDTIYAGAGNDTVYAGAGNDILFAEGGSDLLQGGDGNDQLNGGEGSDSLYGGAGNDSLLGNAGIDYLDGGTGADYFNGGTGFDTFKDDFNLTSPVYNGASTADVIQQQSYTCQTLAALAAHASSGANLASQIVYRGGNQYDVKLFRNGAWYFERVTFDGTWSDVDAAPSRGADGRTLSESWALLFQRARLQQFGLGWRTETTKAQWDAANARSGYRLYDPVDALLTFTGRTPSSSAVNSGSPQALQNALAQKKAVLATTPGATDPASGILGWHTYTITKVFQEGGTWKVQVYNPWGMDGLGSAKDGKNDGVLTITWAQFTRNFNRYSIA